MSDLLTRARTHGHPLVDAGGVTFVWRGRRAPQLVGDFNDWNPDRAPAFRERAPGVWAWRLPLPAEAYIEYAFVQGGKRVPDPLNPARSATSDISPCRHYFYMPGGAPTPLAAPAPRALRGQVTRHVIDVPWLPAARRRVVHLYHPPLPGPAPLVVVYDGQDYLRRARLASMVDNLIHAGRLRPLALAFVERHHPSRMAEYACSELTLGLLLRSVLPLAQAELNLVDITAQPGAYGVLGASMGGLMAAYTGVRLPHLFGHVLSQSGAFSLGGFDFVLWNLLRDGPVLPLRLWLDVGRFDTLELLAANQRLRDRLQERGYVFGYREYAAGHNYTAWRDDVWRGLEWLYSPSAPDPVSL